MTEHTPPPWQVLQSNGHLYVCDCSGNSIPHFWVDDTIAAANANTMAAAPELLAVVELLAANHDVALHLSWDKCDCDVATLGRSAIAKAKGVNDD